MNLKGKCCYIVSAAGVHPQTLCLKPTGYVMARDDDNRIVRVYNTWCVEHAKKVSADDDDE